MVMGKVLHSENFRQDTPHWLLELRLQSLHSFGTPITTEKINKKRHFAVFLLL